MKDRICSQPVGRGTVGENRRCGALALPDWTICAAHLAAARARKQWTEDEITRRFRYRFEGGDSGHVHQ